LAGTRRLEGGGSLRVEHSDRGLLATIEFPGLQLSVPAIAMHRPTRTALYHHNFERGGEALVLADRVTAGSERLAAELGIWILDLDGRGRVVHPPLVYINSGVAPAVTLKQSTASAEAPRSSFAPKSVRLVRTLLEQRDRHWGVRELAEEADLDPSRCTRLLRGLEADGFVEQDRGKWHSHRPDALLQAWAERGKASDLRRTSRASTSQNLEALLRDALAFVPVTQVAISGEFAAERYAPHLPARHAVLYCCDDRDFETLADEVGMRRGPAPSPHDPRAGRIDIVLADEGRVRYAQLKDDLPLACPSQVYVDLARKPGRAAAAAEHLREWMSL
jgi:hypothetical protein